MGSILDDAPARALHLGLSKLVAIAVSGMSTASAALVAAPTAGPGAAGPGLELSGGFSDFEALDFPALV